MKAKFFLFLLLILALGGSGFYFGWIQFQLPEHTYGVIFTKTGGWEEDIVEPGVFSWRWERLIPTNMSIYRIPVRRQSFQVSQKGKLPSSEVYANVLESNEDFEYQVRFSFTYTLKPEFLPRLVRKQGLKPEHIGRWYEGLNRELLSIAVDTTSEMFENIQNGENGALSSSRLEGLLIDTLSEQFEYIDFHGVQPLSYEVPDRDLYYAAKSYYLNILEEKENTEKETISKRRSWVVSEESKLQVLEKYGKLFTDYPGLVRYFSLKETGEFKDLLPSVDLIEDTAKANEGGKEE